MASRRTLAICAATAISLAAGAAAASAVGHIAAPTGSVGTYSPVPTGVEGAAVSQSNGAPTEPIGSDVRPADAPGAEPAGTTGTQTDPGAPAPGRSGSAVSAGAGALVGGASVAPTTSNTVAPGSGESEPPEPPEPTEPPEIDD